MKALLATGIALLLLAGCGGSEADDGGARSIAQVCQEVCGWPDECFALLGVPVQRDECVATCETQAQTVGLACITAIADTVDCLGTCDPESLTPQEISACEAAARGIEVCGD